MSKQNINLCVPYPRIAGVLQYYLYFVHLDIFEEQECVRDSLLSGFAQEEAYQGPPRGTGGRPLGGYYYPRRQDPDGRQFLIDMEKHIEQHKANLNYALLRKEHLKHNALYAWKARYKQAHVLLDEDDENKWPCFSSCVPPEGEMGVWYD